MYVSDVAEIATWVLNNYDSPVPFIMSPDEEVQISTIAHEIAHCMGFDGAIVYDDSYPDGQLKKPSDNSVLKQHMPHFEFTTIQNGLKKAIHWYKENKKDIRS